MFKEEGLDVELVKTDWDGLREGLAGGQFDANHTLVMYLLKAIENNKDLKITGGIHTGCLRLQVSVKSSIKTAAELKGKTIGVPTHIGSPPFMFASRVLAAQGIDPSLDAGQVTWLAIAPDAMAKAVQKTGGWTPSPRPTRSAPSWSARRSSARSPTRPRTSPTPTSTVMRWVVSGKLARKHPKAAAKVTRAMLKAAKWVEENPKAAAQMGVEKKYIASTVDINTQALSALRYIPGVAKCRRSVVLAGEEMRKAKLLNATTDPVALGKRAWADLDGVTDEWVAVRDGGQSGRRAGGSPSSPRRKSSPRPCSDKASSCCACCCLQPD